jgi:hypothetical protein
VFFIGGPDATNVVTDSEGMQTGALPAMGHTQSLPMADPDGLRRDRGNAPVSEGAPAAPVETAATAPEAAPEAAPSATTPKPPVTGDTNRSLKRPDPESSAQVKSSEASLSDSGLGRKRKAEIDYEKAVQAVLSQHTGAQNAVSTSSRYSISTPMAGNTAVADTTQTPEAKSVGTRNSTNSSAPPVVAAPPPDASAAPAPIETPAADSEPDASTRAPVQQLHKVRAASGIVYDFHDEDAVRKWLVTRGSFDDLSYSPDGGESYAPVLAVDEFSDLTPGGLRTRTGSLPAITADVVAARRLSEAVEPRPEDLTSTGRVRTIKPLTSRHAASAADADDEAAAGKAKKIPVWRAAVYVLLATVAALAAAYAFAPTDRTLQIPDTAAGDQLRWVMSTIHGQSGALNLGLVSNHVVPEQLEAAGPAVILKLRDLDSWRDEFTLTEIPVSEELRIVALLTTDRADAGWVLIECAPAPPHLMSRMEFGRGAPPPDVSR